MGIIWRVYLTLIRMYYTFICENFHWMKILPSPAATFVLQKKFVEKIFANAVKVAISSMQSLFSTYRAKSLRDKNFTNES